MEFPRGYWLYERSKHLWVSGFPAKSKLFKSPQEFGVHLLWLFSSSDDRADCCCVHCNVPSAGRGTPSVDDTPAVKPRPSEEPRQDKQTPYAKAVSSLYSSNVSISELGPQAQAQIQSLPGGPVAASQPALAPASSAPIPQTNTTPAPVPGSAQSLLYRTGELVWYTNGPSWRLGLITKSANGTHHIVPLGHSYFRQPLVAKQDGDLRPFQAFTVPPVTVNDFKNRTYDQVPWETVLRSLTAEQAKTHQDVILLDASKLAAQKIDLCYSLFGKLLQEGNESLYQGIFLGAERIEVGDALRVITPTSLGAEGIVYFGLDKIKSEELPTGRAVRFGGAFYELHEGGSAKKAPIPDDALPHALREESIWRKSVAPGKPLSWSMLSGYMWLAESEIKGRFYPTHLLAPILLPTQFAEAVSDGNRAGATPALNGRLMSTAGDSMITGWRLNRMVAAGGSIPHDTVFWFEPQVREEVGGQ